MSNEKEIRELVREHLVDKYQDIKVRDEFSGGMNVRNDLFGVTKENIVSVEIKSDKDNFTRLDNQLIGYLFFSNIVWLAIDEKHYEKYQKQFKSKNYYEKVGVMVLKNGILEIKKEPIILEIPNLYHMMLSKDLTYFFMWFKGKSKIKKDYRTSLYLIKHLFSDDEVYEISKQIFINKHRGFECSFDKKILIDFDEKQEEFKIFYNDEKLMKDVYWGRVE